MSSRGSGSEIDRRVVSHLQNLLTGRLDHSVEKSLQHRKAARFSAGDHRGDGRDLRIVFAECEIAQNLRRNRSRARCAQCRRPEQHQYRDAATNQCKGMNHDDP